MNANDFRIDEPKPIGPESDAPVVQRIHMKRSTAIRLAEKTMEWALATPPGGWVEVNIIGFRLVSPILDSLIVRGDK
jgi:hypothetical protein